MIKTFRYASDITQQVVHSDMKNVAHKNRLTVEEVESMVREVGKLMINIVVDNFLECYHCSVAHKDLITLLDMRNYQQKSGQKIRNQHRLRSLVWTGHYCHCFGWNIHLP